MTEALRYNEDKPELHRLRDFGPANEALAMVLQMGAIKYEERNWLLGGKPDDEYIGSLDRHVQAFSQGAVYDPDSGCQHMAHAAWNALAVIRLNYPYAFPLDPNFDLKAFKERWSK